MEDWLPELDKMGWNSEEVALLFGDDIPPPLYEETTFSEVALNLSISSTEQVSPPDCNNNVDLPQQEPNVLELQSKHNNVDLPQQEPNVLELQSSDDSDVSKKKGRRRRKRTREPNEAQHHIMAERKRRQLAAQLFISLSALLPHLKKMDKTSILGEAIKHMKQLKEKVEALEEAAAKEKVESMVMVKRSKMVADDESSCIGEDVYVLRGGSTNNLLPEIEVTVSYKTTILKLCCERQKGLLAKIAGEMEKHDIIVLHCTVVPLGNSIYNYNLVGQILKTDKMRMKDLVVCVNSIIHAS